MSQTIGEILKQSRKEQNLTIEDAAKQTHLRLHYIKALEENRLDVFPSKTQGRGFLRIYSDFLNLPSNILLAAWDTNKVNLPTEAKDIPQTEAVAQISVQHFERSETVLEELDEVEHIPDDPEIELASEEPKESEEINSSVPITRNAKEPTPSNRIPTPKADAIFYEIGQQLSNQRESLGLSLVDIERYTHIRLQYLQAIEKGDIHKLPSSVQGKGMVDNYAKFLDMDSNAILMRFADALLTQRTERQDIKQNIKEEKPAKKRKKRKASGIRGFLTPDLLIGGAVIAGFIIFAVWSVSQVIDSRNAAMQATVPGISEVLLETPEDIVSGTATPTEINQVTSSAENSEAPDLETVTGDPDENAETETGDSTFEEINSIDNNPLQIYIVAHQRAYLRVIIDGETHFNGRVSPGNAYPFSGAEQVELLTGNAAALQVFFNQNDLGTIGTFGQVSNLIFTNNGMVTPTPLFTYTPTPTMPATVTLQPSPTPQTPTVTPMIP